MSADELMDAVKSDERDLNNIARDIYRNPYETLSFFEITPSMTVFTCLEKILMLLKKD